MSELRVEPRVPAWMLWIGLTAAAPAFGQDATPSITRPGAGAGATRIHVAFFIADIDSIDSANQLFEANIAVVLRWHDPRLAHDSAGAKTYGLADIWNPQLLCVNLASGKVTRRSLAEVAQVEQDGTVVLRQRYLGSFSQALDLRDFPFDHHDFRVHFVSTGHPPSEVEFVADKTWIERGLPEAVKLAEQLSLPDWEIESIGSRTLPYAVTDDERRAGIAVEFTAKRSWLYFVWRMMVPLTLIIMMSWTVFWIHPTQGGTQVSVAVTSMLTLIAFQLVIDQRIPPVSYMTRMGVFLQLSTMLVFLALVEVIVTTRLAYREQLARAERLDAVSRIAFPAALLLVIFVSFVL